MLGALAVVDLVRHVGLAEVGIKWPNDVLVQGRKVSGVLAEAEWDDDRLLGAVLGIGVNVRVDFRNTPLATTAISLEAALGRSLDRLGLLTVLLDRVTYWYERLDSAAFFEAWRNVLLTLGHPVRVGELEGVAESVDATGALWLRLADSQVRRVVAGDVEMQSE
jgi:BirA family biotin operon repressor/biotin-[acetyl-CoA-carboxylase] ligase